MSAYSSFIGLINPKSPQNVGTIMRAAGCYSADAVFYTGQRYEYARQFNTDTQNVHMRIPLKGVDSLPEHVPSGTKIVAVELVEGAVPLTDYQHPEHAFYIFGPEDGSINQDIINVCDDVVYIPTVGCMNLAATVNVLLYDRMLKLGTANLDPELIKSSRDTNNKAKVINK